MFTYAFNIPDVLDTYTPVKLIMDCSKHIHVYVYMSIN